MPVAINDEIIWSAISAIVVGIILKTSDFIMSRNNLREASSDNKIDKYHESLEEELASLRVENRELREEADRYRAMYRELFDLVYRKDPTS
jgi:hypothetical protein